MINVEYVIINKSPRIESTGTNSETGLTVRADELTGQLPRPDKYIKRLLSQY